MSNTEWLHNVKKEYSKRRSTIFLWLGIFDVFEEDQIFVPTEASRKAIGIRH